LALFLVA